ncbi:MAG TPA: MFS transporter [Baekduia sp.]|nr:MFS transporter [Baekduia sp.]
MTPQPLAQQKTDAMGSPARWRSLGIISAALLIVIIDITVLHIAAPSIAEDLKPSSTELLWIVDIYALVAAPLLLAAATLGDRFGRKRVLIVGLIIFTSASAFAAFATNPEMLIAGRALQGVGGAMVMPNTMSIIRALFPDRRERVKAIGIWSAILAGGGAAGPLVGGFLVEHFWWGAVFLINVPILAVVLPFAILGLPEVKHSDPPPWDTVSVLAATLGVLLLAFGIKEGARLGITDPKAFGTFLPSIVLLTLFVRRQIGNARPLLDVSLFRRPVFAVAVATTLVALVAWVGLELFLAQYLQFVLGLGPSTASLWMLPSIVAMLVASLFVSPLLHALGSRVALAGGFGVFALCLASLLLLDETPRFFLFAVPFVVLGVVVQIATVASNDALMSSVSADDAGQVASIEATSYDLGGGIGVAILGSLGAAIYTKSFEPSAGLTAGQAADSREAASSAFDLAKDLPGAAGDALFIATRDAWMSAFHVVIIAGILLIVASTIAWLVVFVRTGDTTELVRAGSSPHSKRSEDADDFWSEDQHDSQRRPAGAASHAMAPRVAARSGDAGGDG